MNPNPVLLLWLEGPLQSWGSESLFSRRASLDFPTRSGVLGLLLAALGAGGEQRELLARFAPLPQTVIAYGRLQPKRALYGRADPPQTEPKQRALAEPPLQLCDFHMVGSGYDDKDPWEKLHIPKTSEGKPAVGGGTKLTYRYYVQDMAFAVLLPLPEDMAEMAAEALCSPVWDTALGRRCCVPTEFVYQGTYADETAAMTKAMELAQTKDRREAFRVSESPDDDENARILSDVPVCFGPRKRYRERRVYLVRPREERP
jgi:CRISPR system Cascade subunit CasD